MSHKPEPITSRLSLVEDTCSVYFVESEGRILLIDCAVQSDPERVLLTHFHRDQCDSAPKWQRAGASVTVPYCERKLF